MPKKIIPPAVFLVVCTLPMLMRGSEYYLHIYIMCAINIILAASLGAMAATGQISIGQAGFMAVGAYASAVLATKIGVPVYLALFGGGLAAMVLAAIIGFPLSRVKTVYFVMVTMFVGEIIRLVIFELRGITGGSTGLIGIPRPESFSLLGVLELDFTSKLQFSYLVLIVLLLILLVLYNIHRSHAGTVLSAIGQEDLLAASVGINVARYKVLILCVCSFFTGLAGSLYAHYMTVLNPDAFNVFTSLYIMIYVVIGGKRFSGPIVGAVILTLIPELFSALGEYQPFVFVLVLFLVVFLLPGGLVELPRLIRSRLRGAR